MGTTGCLLLIAAIAAQAAATGKMEDEVSVQLPFGSSGFCIRLLNETHQFGCTSREGDEGVIVVVRTKADLEGVKDGWKDRFPGYQGGFMVLIDELLLDGDTAPLLISSSRVSGVLLMPRKGEVDTNIPLSAEAACPNKHSSLYSDWRACGSTEKKQWNANGAMMEEGMRFTDWPKPITRILNESTLATMIKCHDSYNLPDSRTGKVEGRLCAVGTVKTFMHAAGSSAECMRRQDMGMLRTLLTLVARQGSEGIRCDPLLDYNIFGVIPPGSEKKTGNGEYLAILTRMDSIAMLPTASPSTYGTMTSILTALTAAKVIGDNLSTFERASEKSNKRIIFAFLHGESFDYVGSSRWVYDMEQGKFPKPSRKSTGDVPELISLDKISLAVELQQLDGSKVLHAHVDGENYEADKKGKITETVEKIKNKIIRHGYDLHGEKLHAYGVLPPSSLHSILKRKRDIPSVLLTSFDKQYSNLRFHSVFDRVTGGAEEVQRVNDTIKAVASGVVAMMADHVGIDEGVQKNLTIDQEWLDMLISCFIATTKIPDCPYLKRLFKEPENTIDRNLFIGTRHEGLMTSTLHALLQVATGEHISTSNVHSEESCSQVNEKQSLYEYAWLPEPAENTSDTNEYFCYRTSISDSIAKSPAFNPDSNEVIDFVGSSYSTWVESRWGGQSPYSLFLVESRPADWTILIVGLWSSLLCLLIVGRCNDSSFIVDEGERIAEEGEPFLLLRMSEDGKALKSDRRKCYQARDSYFSCTDTILDSGKSEKEAEKACRSERGAFEANCPSSWVVHFIRKHNFERYKAQLISQGNSPVSRAAATHPPKHRSKAAAPPPLELLQKQKLRQLQQLWELSKESTKELDPLSNIGVQKVLGGDWDDHFCDKWGIVKSLSDKNDFKTIEKLLEVHSRSELDKKKVPDMRLVADVIWAAVAAKSLGSLSPSVLDWIEKAVRRLPEPIPSRKESMIWLLSILRDDFPTLQQLQQESCSKVGGVGPEIERRKTLGHVAMSYLEAGKTEEFRSMWTSSGSPLLEEEDWPQQSAAMVHHAVLRRTVIGKRDPAMLRWYAEWLVANQRTPIPERRQFMEMMVPVVKALGGKIEKWREEDRRMTKLRKWRDDYDDVELDKLVHSMLDYMRHRIVVEKYGSLKDLSRLGRMLSRLNSGGERGSTVVIDWLNFIVYKQGPNRNIINILPSHSLVVVGRERHDSLPDSTPVSPDENKRVKVMEVTRKKEKSQEVDDVCSMILAVATRGHLLSNDKTRPHVLHFKKYLQNQSKDVSQSILLKNYLNDAVLRHSIANIQPVVDHSKGAQWIDKGKKELAFTVARSVKRDSDSPFKYIDYYSLHIE